MADKLERLQRVEREAKQAQDKAHKEALEVAKKAAAVVRKAKEEKWKVLGEMVDQAGLGDLAPAVLKQRLAAVGNGSTPEAAETQGDESQAEQGARIAAGVTALDADERADGARVETDKRGIRMPWEGR